MKQQHAFTENHPVFSSLLFTLGGFWGFALLPSLLNLPLTKAFPGYPLAQGPVGVVGTALLVLFLYKQRFRPDISGLLTGGRPALGFRLGLLYLIYLAFSFWLTFFLRRVPFGIPSFEALSTAIFAGVGEEVCFRGLMLGTLMRQWRREDRLVPALLINALLFGLLHGSNLFFGALPGVTVLQILAGIGAGGFFAAVFLRSANLWPVILLHLLQDALAFCALADVNQSGIITAPLSIGLTADGLACFLMLPVGLLLIRREKRGEILELWEKKWGGGLTGQKDPSPSGR